MQFYILGASIFFFSSSLALHFAAYRLLNRAVDVLRFSIELQERLHRENLVYVSRNEGSD